MDLYCKAIGDKNELYLSEAHLSQSPILIDIDIKYHLPEQSDAHHYQIQDIELVIQLYNKFICKFLKVSEDHLKIYLLEKDGPTYTGLKENGHSYKDDVHIIYPEICTPSNVQFIIVQIKK